jgi:hypothetical protein
MTVSPVVGSVSPLQFAAVPHTFVPAPLSHVRVVCEKRSGAASRANARAVARVYEKIGKLGVFIGGQLRKMRGLLAKPGEGDGMRGKKIY